MSRGPTSASRFGHPAARGLGSPRRRPPLAPKEADALEEKLASARRSSIREALSARDAGRLDPETQSLLLRQLAVTRFEAGRLDEVLEIAGRIVALGVLSDLGHHEAARAHAARGEHRLAAAADLLAARGAPPERRAFFWWSVATHLEHAGDADRALDALRRASRWATEAGRPLYRAHAAAIRLSLGRPAPDLARIVSALEGSPQRDGYGRYLLGRIAHGLGREAQALGHLRAFLRRHASSDVGVQKTLEWELENARTLARALDRSMA